MEDWMIWSAAGAGVLILVIILLIIAYKKGKKKGMSLAYAVPMKKPEQVDDSAKVLEIVKPFLPERMLELFNVEKEKVSSIELSKLRTVVEASVLYGGAKVETIPRVEDQADDLYDKLNYTMSTVIPSIKGNDGAIESIQDGFYRALFFASAEAALKSAVQICDTLQFKNLTMGLAYGRVSVGIVGNEKRMEIITISSCAHVAETLRMNAVEYYSKILVTESFVRRIPDFEKKYNSRMLGTIVYPDSGDSEIIYDVFDGDEVEVRNRKRKTKTLFEKGVQLYLKRSFSEARGYFVEVMKADHHDLAARNYLFLCDKYSKQSPDENDAVDTGLLRV
ncbi:MAG: hypothetical protein J5819_05075 [Eubacterium sp.]|nr:hypothetical protein [Eubacterium sp.]